MLLKTEERWLPIIMVPLAKAINRFGVSPNTVTIFRFIATVLIGYLLTLGYLRNSGFFVLLAGSFDSLDGTLARLSKKESRFGALLDSTLDRYGDAVIYGGLLIYLLTNDSPPLDIILLYATAVGVVMIAYIRFRAITIGMDVYTGVLTRTDHIIVLSVGLMLNQLTWTLLILALTSNITSIQRMWTFWKATNEE